MTTDDWSPAAGPENPPQPARSAAEPWYNNKPLVKPSVWDRATRWVTPLMVAASLALGVKHEIQRPAPQPAPIVSSYAGEYVANRRDAIDRIQEKVNRLENQTTPMDASERNGLYFSIVEDLKQLLTISCTPSAKSELLTLIVDLQVLASQKVAKVEAVTPIERRLQRLLVTLLNACR